MPKLGKPKKPLQSISKNVQRVLAPTNGVNENVSAPNKNVSLSQDGDGDQKNHKTIKTISEIPETILSSPIDDMMGRSGDHNKKWTFFGTDGMPSKNVSFMLSTPIDTTETQISSADETVKNVHYYLETDKNVQNGATDKNVQNGATDKNVQNGATDKNVQNGSTDEHVQLDTSGIPGITEHKREASGKILHSCLVCDYTTIIACNLDQHLKTRKHRNAIAVSQNQAVAKNKQEFVCQPCDFVHSSKKNYLRHLQSKKHAEQVRGKNIWICVCGEEFKTNSGLYKHKKKCTTVAKSQVNDCKCGRHFVTASGLYKHKKTCNETNKEASNALSVVASAPLQLATTAGALLPNQLADMMEVVVTKVVDKVMDTHKDIMHNTIGQITEMQTQTIAALSQARVSNTTNNTDNSSNKHTNSHNKTFNLQFFLNEQCKDAMNINDFVESIRLGAAELERVGELGYVNGMANLITSQLSTLDVHKRPIHCSDSKRHVMHVKHEDKWQKETADYPIIRQAIKSIGHGLFQSVGTWANLHPEAITNVNSHWNDTYMKILKQASGGHGDYDENNMRIMKKLAQIVVIERT